jgi:hypothetical protein
MMKLVGSWVSIHSFMLEPDRLRKWFAIGRVSLGWYSFTKTACGENWCRIDQTLLSEMCS